MGAWAAYEVPAFEFEEFHHAQGNPQVEAGYSFGAIASISLSNKSDIRVGAGVVRKGFEVEWDWAFSDPMDPLIPITTNYRAHYIQIPVTVDYNLGPVVPSAGLQMLVLADNKALSVMGDESESDLDVADVNWTYFAIQPRLAVGYEILVNADMMIRLEPYLLFDLQSFSDGHLKDGTPTIGAWMDFIWSF